MVVSDAFETFTQVLECLDSSDTEVKSVSVRGQTTADNDEISADLTLATPVFGGVSIHDDVSVDAEEFDVIDKRIEIDVTVTVPVGTNIPSRQAIRGTRPTNWRKPSRSRIPCQRTRTLRHSRQHTMPAIRSRR